MKPDPTRIRLTPSDPVNRQPARRMILDIELTLQIIPRGIGTRNLLLF